MAIQQWTIISLVGPAADDAWSRVSRWARARRSKDLSCFSTSDWSAPTRRAASKYLAHLELHRMEMPIAYFSQHVDPWLAGGTIQYHLPGAHSYVWHDAGELWCFRMPDRGRLVRRNLAQARKPQFPEVAWLANRLIEAARAHTGCWKEATLLINRHAIRSSKSDEQLKLDAAVMPKWLGRGRPRD